MRAGSPASANRVRVDGKFFSLDGRRFNIRGVTYGTFRPRSDGARLPELDQVRLDFAAIRDAGFNTVRTYTSPPDDVLDIAAEHDLRVLAGLFYEDWRYLVGHSRRQQRHLAVEARRCVETEMARLAGRSEVLAVCVGNEIPADTIRWVGQRRVAAEIEELVDLAHRIDPEMLVTYGNYPTSEYLTLDRLDFLMFNLFLEREEDFRRYVNRLQNLAGDRPLVLGELGHHAEPGSAGETAQAEAIDWQLSTAVERGVAGHCVFAWTDEWHVGDAPVDGWRFGLTRQDRTPRPALQTAARWNAKTVSDVDFDWPSISVVICAHNSAATLDECLDQVSRLDYPGLEVIVVDDGSTDATAAIAGGYERVRLVKIAHGGLSVARNEGVAAARGDLVAFLDSDAFPPPEWPYFLALGLDRADVFGVGGPNLPPPGDSLVAHAVSRAPGGPVHVLLTDDRAEHLPGCNMAFWRDTLLEVGGFDPAYTAAGDDVDLCWRVIDRGGDIAFHPGAMVWHHRRAERRGYLRQQHGYGRAEALVAARHPNRFTALGSARWHGPMYDGFAPLLSRQPIYHGPFGTAAYQSVYRGRSHALDFAHQAGVPLGLAALPFSLSPIIWARATGVLALLLLVALFIVDAVAARPPRGARKWSLRFRADVALLSLLQPLVRTVGRLTASADAARELAQPTRLPGPALRRAGGTVLVSVQGTRAELMNNLVAHLRHRGLQVTPPTGWEDHDFTVVGSALVLGDVVSTSQVDGFVQVRVRLRPRAAAFVALFALILGMALAAPAAAGIVAFAGLGEIARGFWNARHRVLGVLVEGSAGQASASQRLAPRAVGEGQR
ncbi:MAG TPA: glycosyltransferase [Candidatus Solibacter sp.]|jgi:glycosyltransferase involved in cell wall biosynthesis|nr:glycosyltransferase [Candidatus Solibacter sp.]